MKRAIKFTQQMIKKDSVSEKGLRDGVSPFEDIKHEFERISVHLQNLSSPELQSETGGIDKVSECWSLVRAKQWTPPLQDQWRTHLINFDLSGSDTEKVMDVIYTKLEIKILK